MLLFVKIHKITRTRARFTLRNLHTKNVCLHAPPCVGTKRFLRVWTIIPQKCRRDPFLVVLLANVLFSSRGHMFFYPDDSLESSVMSPYNSAQHMTSTHWRIEKRSKRRKKSPRIPFQTIKSICSWSLWIHHNKMVPWTLMVPELSASASFINFFAVSRSMSRLRSWKNCWQTSFSKRSYIDTNLQPTIIVTSKLHVHITWR